MRPSGDTSARRGDRFWDRLAAVSIARPWGLLACGFALFVATAPFAARLYGDLRTDLRELLPQGAPSAVALEELENRIGGFGSLAVVVRTDDLKAGERFVDALGSRLRGLSQSLVASVWSRVDEERSYFEEHGVLYADVTDLVELRDGITSAKRKANPLVIDLDDEAPPAKDDAAALQDSAGRLRPPNAAVSLEENQALFEAVDREVKKLNPRSFHPSLRIGYGGEVRGVIEAQQNLVRDLLVSTVLVLTAVGIALLLYYRSWRSIPLLVIPLFTGVSLTFAISRWTIHYLNPNTAFLGSIILGNGINAGIILLARYFEERRSGTPIEVALPVALKTTWLATFAAAAAAAASYGSLGAVSFRGFNQFGFMGLCGMILCWVTTYIFMPPMIAVAERIRPFRERRRSRVVGWIAGPYATLLTRHTFVAAAISLAIAVFAGMMSWRFARQPIEYDFRKLGSRQGLADGAAYWDRHVDAVLQSYQTPTVVLTDSAAQARAVAYALEEVREQQGPSGTIESVQTLHKLVPTEQPRKLDLLRDIFQLIAPPKGQPELIDERILSRLPEDLRAMLLRLRERTILEPVVLDQVPARLKLPFREKDGEQGRIVLVYPTLATDSTNGKAQLAHAKLVRDNALRADPTARVAGQLVLTSDILDSIIGDGRFAATLSFLAVAVLTLVVMRSMRGATWVLGSLCLGVLWMFGCLGALHLKLNFVNFAVLPITFGIGVDYAVNFYQRYRQSSGVDEALATAGGAVTLCSASTIIGYATLLTADNMAIQSFGLIAVLGELTCLSAALFALPAVLAWRDRRKPQGEVLDDVLPAPEPVAQPERRREVQGL
jgi:predicted RND superfamily exporter protein